MIIMNRLIFKHNLVIFLIHSWWIWSTPPRSLIYFFFLQVDKCHCFNSFISHYLHTYLTHIYFLYPKAVHWKLKMFSQRKFLSKLPLCYNCHRVCTNLQPKKNTTCRVYMPTVHVSGRRGHRVPRATQPWILVWVPFTFAGIGGSDLS